MSLEFQVDRILLFQFFTNVALLFCEKQYYHPQLSVPLFMACLLFWMLLNFSITGFEQIIILYTLVRFFFFPDVSPAWSSLTFLDLWGFSFHKFGNFSAIIIQTFFYSLPSCKTLITYILGCFILSCTSLMNALLIFFNPFYSVVHFELFLLLCLQVH